MEVLCIKTTNVNWDKPFIEGYFYEVLEDSRR